MRYTTRQFGSDHQVLDFGRVIVTYKGAGSREAAREDAADRNIGPSELEMRSAERQQMGISY